MNLLQNAGLELFCRLVLASVFLMSGILKVLAGRDFANTIAKFKVLPAPLGRLYAAVLPWAEITVALLLFPGLASRYAAGVVVLMLVSFLLATLLALKRKLNLECGCFGLLYRERVGMGTLARDSVLLAFALEVLSFDGGRFALRNMLGKLDQPANILAVIFIGLSLSASLSLSLIASGRLPRKSKLRRA